MGEMVTSSLVAVWTCVVARGVFMVTFSLLKTACVQMLYVSTEHPSIEEVGKQIAGKARH
jgi:hypothetical protein